MIIQAPKILTAEGVLESGWVTVEHGLITGIGGAASAPPSASAPASAPASGPPSASAGEHVRFAEGWLLPGFIDMHCHGGMQADFASADSLQLRTAARFHAEHGTAAMLASLVSNPVDELCRQLGAVADLVESGTSAVIGAHLEGPFLAASRCGAQNPAHLIEPSVAVFHELLQASRSTLRMITIAPELPHAEHVIRAATAAGVIAAVGHTDCSYETAMAAFSAGATVATHLFNGMPPVHHRAPGPVAAALESQVSCEIICDGVHVHPAALRLVAASPARLLLITDAMSAAGAGDGRYLLGGLDVTVAQGQARLSQGGSLAGSTLSMDQAFRWAVQAGLSVAQASAAASANPARLLGISDSRGAIAVGRRADFVQVDADHQVRRVMSAGQWLF